MLELVIVTVVFVLFSGLLAMIDAAVLSVSPAETQAMVKRGEWGAGQLKRVTSRLTHALVVIVIATNSVNILGPILVGQVAVANYGTAAIGWMTVVLTFATIVFSEIIPKSIGSHRAPLISRFAAPPILALTCVLYPLVVALAAFSRLFQRGGRRVGTEAQIRGLTTLGRRAGLIEADEGHLVHRAFTLNDRTAGEIMTPREDVAVIASEATIDDAAAIVRERGFSRYPVLGGSAREVVGAVLARDILDELARGRGGDSIESIVRKHFAVGADERSDRLLLSFRLRRTHLAVVESDGRMIGVVTLEDVLEELVGEIHDEKDTPF